MKAVEFYACEECGEYPIEKVVDTETDELTKCPVCPKCKGKTHFEKVRKYEDCYVRVVRPRMPSLKGNPAYDLMM